MSKHYLEGPGQSAAAPVPESCNCPLRMHVVSGWHSWWCLSLEDNNPETKEAPDVVEEGK